MGNPEIWGSGADELLVIGLTGGIASGKSEVTSRLATLGAMIVDADSVAREVTVPGTDTFERILDEFGPVILDRNGTIDRLELAARVFGDERKRQFLNSVTHPAIFTEIMRKVEEYGQKRKPGDVPAVVVDAALIVDIGASEMFDLLAVVVADEEERVRRLTGTRGMSEDDSRRRVESQIDDSSRIALADIVIDNNGSIEELYRKVDEFWDEVTGMARSMQS